MRKKGNSEEISSFRKVIEVCTLLFGGAAKRFPLFFVFETLHTILDAINPFINLIFTPLIIDELLTKQRMNVLMTY